VFGEAVRAQRRRLGLSQEDLAARTGIGVRSIGKIENGRITSPRPATVRLLADAFGLTGGARDQFCQAVDAGASAESGARSAPPAQLPADVTGFVGRVQPLRQLTDLFAADDGSSAPGIIVIAGTVGVGKTTLACHWAHRIRDRFGDGQLYVNLRGFDSAVTALHPAQAIRGFLDALGVHPDRVPVETEALAALYRTLLAGRRMLIMLDNARDAEQVRPLLPGAPGCLVMITSRDQLSSLVAADSAYPIALDLLSRDEAEELLVARLGADRIAAEPGPVDEIISYSARLPLALAIVAARAATHPGFPLRTFAAELRDTHDRLDALAAGEDPATDVRTVISWSYRRLSPDAARLFRLLGIHPGPSISAAAASSLAEVPLRQARRLLAELAGMHLIVESTPGRYTFHDLLRAYALEQAQATEPDAERRAAVHRMLDHYLWTSYTAALLLNPARDALELPAARPGVTPEPLTGHEQAMAWFAAEHATLLAAIDAAGRAGLDTHTWQLAWSLVHFFDRGGHWHDWAVTQATALDSARRLGDPTTQAQVHRFLALAYIQLHRFADAHDHLEQALALYHRTADPLGQAHTEMHLGLAWVRQGDNPRALDNSKRALALFEAADHRAGQALAHNGIGWLQAQLGAYEPALESCLRALALAQQIGSPDEQAAILDSLGYVHFRIGNHADALDYYQQALDVLSTIGDRYREAGTLTRLGEVHHGLGDLKTARAAWYDALVELEALGHPDADQLRNRLDTLTE
jgi:tetratricopeptide (TPR) repeat protein/transcriptional regulator with XRE-family HTH domain